MRDRIVYYAEALGSGRAQLCRDVVVDGALVPELGGPVGSPAPAAVVAAHERTLTFPRAAA